MFWPGESISERGPLANTRKKNQEGKCLRMWISILNPEITGKHSK